MASQQSGQTRGSGLHPYMFVARNQSVQGPGQTEAHLANGFSAGREKPSVQLAGDLGRGFATESKQPRLCIRAVQSCLLALQPRERGGCLTRSTALGKQPFAQEAQISSTALPDLWNTLAFNLSLE